MPPQVRISEFNSKPLLCRITGSGAPGLVKDRLLLETLRRGAAAGAAAGASGRPAGGGAGAAGAPGGSMGIITMDMLDGTQALRAQAKELPVNAGGGMLGGGEPERLGAGAGARDGWTKGGGRGVLQDLWHCHTCACSPLTNPSHAAPPAAAHVSGPLLPAWPHAGAGNGDAFTASQAQERLAASQGRDCRTAGPIKVRPPRPPRGPRESNVNGIYVPDNLLLATADVSYVLNQSDGKLRIKDVKGAIAARKAGLAAQQAALDAVLAEGISEGLHPLERPDIPADVKVGAVRREGREGGRARQVQRGGRGGCGLQRGGGGY